jgi:GT2 family glycosyltransferase/SAM-dependent methyltransferase/glycosyltransferase involved in cell wall biosynthesis
MTSSIEFTGERFIPEGMETEITLEHVHRYLMAARLCEGAVVLDAACGSGYGTGILSSRAAMAYGVDVDPEAVAYAEAHYGGEKVAYRTASVTDLPFESDTFDVVVSFETLEHLEQQAEMLAEFRRVLKPQGVLIISTPDKPIYNAALAEPNAFHVAELTRGEFETLVRERFKTVELYGQRIVFGSLTVAQQPSETPNALRRKPSPGGGLIDQSIYDASMYLIAVCSDGSVQRLPVGIYEGAVPQNAIASLMGGIAERDRMVREWRERAETSERLQAEQAEDIKRVRDLQAQLDEQTRYLAAATQVVRDVGRRAANFDPRFWEALPQEQRSDGGNSLNGALQRLVTLGLQETLRNFVRRLRGGWSRRLDPRLALGDAFVAARRARLRPMRALRLFLEIRLVRNSGLLDPGFYAHQKERTPIPNFEDARNYVLVGRDLAPNRLFSGAAYLRLNPDVDGSQVTPLAHFIRYGAWEGRSFEPPAEGPHEFLRPEDRTKEEWPYREGVDLAQASAYAARPDDDVLNQAYTGKLFLERHQLLGDSPDFATAVAELQAMTPRSKIVGEQDERPIASIVVPVYGQLAYTLNCLHALFEHGAQNSFEILVGDDASPDDSGHWLPQIPNIRYVRHPKNLGFVDNCNTTAALARGAYVVMLNNDTRVVGGWLDAMIDSFGLFPKAGLIGSKLLYEDGELQEAGGLLWQDGSAWNYGRGDDPNRPRYCYAREVDYVSGASIAIPTPLWKQLGGFDPLYRPAYCEDSDIAFRIRAAGFETWMQPLSRVIHYEGRTSGTDLTQGVKAYQVANSKKLAERWAAELSRSRPNGHAPMMERDRKLKKRVLVLDATTPTPNEDAGSVTSTIHMRLYQQLGYKVYFAPMHNFLFQPGVTSELQRSGIEAVYAPYEPNLETFLRRYGRYLDVVHVFRVDVAVEALDLVRRYAPQAPVVFANMDMHHLRMERQAETTGDADLMEEARLMKRKELELIAAVDCSIIHSPVEEEIVKREVPDATMVIFPFITPLMGTRVGFDQRSGVTFLGGYRHTPNIDAAVFLAKEIWPLVRPHLPGAKLVLAGAHPTSEVKALAADDIVVTGLVPDLRPLFDQSRVFAASIRYGAGVKGKVSTAMSFAVPVVATTIAAEGMFLEDGRHVIIADDPAAFAKAVVDLYQDPELWARYSQNALEFVGQTNSMENGRRMLARSILQAELRHSRRVLEDARAALQGLLGTEA